MKIGLRILAFTVVALALVFAPAAKADSYTYSVANQKVINIGNDGTQGGDYDWLSLVGGSGTIPSASVFLKLGALTFTDAINCSNGAYCSTLKSSLPLAITIGALTETFKIPIIATIGYVFDVINLPSTVFRFVFANGSGIQFTTVALTLSGAGGPNPSTGELTATAQFVALTPEPVTLLLFGTGLVGIAGLMRRRLFA